ncbi:hypothetical protein TNCV_3930021 [Trichonephila clavipes]|nr:hypothetical protein TNCV_3930021 [Trichonephila clavipes]
MSERGDTHSNSIGSSDSFHATAMRRNVINDQARQIAALSHPPSSITELKRALQDACKRLSPQLIHHLIASMVNRCAASLAVRGDPTRLIKLQPQYFI